MLMCMSFLPAHMYVYRVHGWFPKRLEEDIGSPGSGARDHGEQPCEWCESSVGLWGVASALHDWAIWSAPGTFVHLSALETLKNEVDWVPDLVREPSATKWGTEME